MTIFYCRLFIAARLRGSCRTKFFVYKGGDCKMDKKIYLALLALFLLAPMVLAQEMGEIMEPLNKIYDLIKTGVLILGLIALTIAGARFMFSSDNIQARESAKNMATYSIIGLVVVWVAPLVVTYLTAP